MDTEVEGHCKGQSHCWHVRVTSETNTSVELPRAALGPSRVFLGDLSRVRAGLETSDTIELSRQRIPKKTYATESSPLLATRAWSFVLASVPSRWSCTLTLWHSTLAQSKYFIKDAWLLSVQNCSTNHRNFNYSTSTFYQCKPSVVKLLLAAGLNKSQLPWCQKFFN